MSGQSPREIAERWLAEPDESNREPASDFVSAGDYLRLQADVIALARALIEAEERIEVLERANENGDKVVAELRAMLNRSGSSVARGERE